jgi:hypothetical protein
MIKVPFLTTLLAHRRLSDRFFFLAVDLFLEFINPEDPRLATIPMACTQAYNSEPQLLRTKRSRDDLLLEIKSAQAISGSNIDSGKLTALLRIKFGAGAYNVHVSFARVDRLDTLGDRY